MKKSSFFLFINLENEKICIVLVVKKLWIFQTITKKMKITKCNFMLQMSYSIKSNAFNGLGRKSDEITKVGSMKSFLN